MTATTVAVVLLSLNIGRILMIMWHEARRQERKIRGMLVDYRRRAERRRDFYERIKADPTQFLQVHGRQCKIHLDPNIAAAADSAVMMPWQGQSDILIDRFDGRAHLDYIPVFTAPDESELSQEDRQINYERYRIIAQNSFLSIPEEKFLKQLHLEEQFGYTEVKYKKEPRNFGAAIGFNYEEVPGAGQSAPPNKEEESDDNDSDSDLDVDLAINVSKMDPAQAHEMNKHGRNYGMSSNDFYSFLTNDLEEAEAARLAREEEQEKALFSGRKSRRERRHHREKRLANRVLSPPSYAARTSPTFPTSRDSKSKSASPEIPEKITYITSFGDDEESIATSKATYADKVKYGKSTRGRDLSSERSVGIPKRRDISRSRERDKHFPTRNRSRSSSRRNRSYSSHGKGISRSRSDAKHVSPRRRRSRSRSIPSNKSSSRRRPRRMSQTRSKNIRSRSSSASRSRSRSRTRYSSSSRRRTRRYSSSSSSSSASSKPKSIHTVESPGSTSPIKISPEISETAPKVVPRYYGRKKSDQSSSESSNSDMSDTNMQSTYNKVNSESTSGHGNSSTAIKASSTNRTVIERLRLKRQVLLNRQFKADKVAEQQKTEREKLEQQAREDELRDMAIKLRRRQREIRHANDSRSSSSSDSASNKVKDTEMKSLSPDLEYKSSSQSKKEEGKERETREDQGFSSEVRSGNKERRDKDRMRRERRSPSPPRFHHRDERMADRRKYDKYNRLVDY